MRRLLVASGLLRTGGEDDRLLLVCNQRKRSRDWTTPGGVVKAYEASTPTTGLSREVKEETGLLVHGWKEDPIYRVEAVFHDLGLHLDVWVYEAKGWTGELRIGEDPDGIVVAARWVPVPDCGRLLGVEAPLWVAEPLCNWLTSAPGELPSFVEQWRYLVNGEDMARVTAIRLRP